MLNLLSVSGNSLVVIYFNFVASKIRVKIESLNDGIVSLFCKKTPLVS